MPWPMQKAGKYACFEFEKKFVLPRLPTSLSENYKIIEDRYFDDTNLRLRVVRSRDGEILDRKLTQKYVTPESHLSKTTITNIYLNEIELNFLSQLCGQKLKKIRYPFVHAGRTFSIDAFIEPHAGLVLAEIEFSDEEEMKRFAAPFADWREVTLDKNYSGGFLASQLKFPILKTENLTLRLPELNDIPQIISFLKENESHLGPFQPKPPDGLYTEEFWRRRVAKIREAFSADQAARFYIFDKNSQVAGSIEFSQIARGALQACYMGYGLAKKYEGKGVMFEAAGAALAFAFKEMNLHRIMANHLPENNRSAKLLMRLGFTNEGLAKNYLQLDGAWRDHVLNSLTNENWRG